MQNFHATSSEGVSPRARIRNYFLAAFPDAKTVKVRDYFRNSFKVRLRFNTEGHKSTVYGIIRNDDLSACQNLRLLLIEKMERYC